MKIPLEIMLPWLLLGLPLLLPILWWWQRRSLSPLTRRQRLISLILRSSIMALVVAALTEPLWLSERRATHVFWAVDVSRSVGGEAVRTATNFVAAANKAGGIESSGWLAFAGRAATLKNEIALGELAPRTLRDDATNLAGALQFAEASFPLGFAKTVVLFSDGQQTAGNLDDQLAELNRRGIRIHTVMVSPPDRPEVLVRGVEAPRHVKEDEPFRVSTEIVSNREQEAEVDFFQNGTKVGMKTVTLQRGANRLEFTQSVKGEKVFEFAAAVRGREDTLADNNQAASYVLADGKSKVLLLADKPDHARYLSWALKQEGILLDVRPFTGAPTEMGDLQNYDLVIMDNIPATDLLPEQLKLLASYVRDFGGGLLMMGGDQSFGLGGYYHTPVEEVLPVRCDFEKEKENPSLGLVLVIDRSGSMTGDKIEMAKDAARAAVELLSARDYVGVVAFDNEAFWVAELQSAADRADVCQRISTIQPGGGTNIAPGMELGYSRLGGTPAKLKHMIVLTDGISTPGPFYEITTRMAQEKITVSTVAVGSDADQRLLQEIARWGNGRYYYSDSPQSIPQIFARETMAASKSVIQEMPFLPRIAKPADFLAGVNFDSAPFLLGYVTTKAKPTSDLWLMTEKGEPLLATWRVGLGQAGAFTSDARNRWAVEWLKWEGYGKFWAQITRKLTRAGSLRHFPVELRRENGGFRLLLDAVDERGNFITELDGEVLLLDPDGKETRSSMHATAPGRFETWWPAGDKGTYHAQLVLKKETEPMDRQYVSASVGYPEEFILCPANETRLRAIADATGGKFQPAPDEIIRGDTRRAPFERECWPWLVGTALALFIADVAVKRWPG